MTKRLIWITDPHFDHMEGHCFPNMVNHVRDKRPDLVLITGDIADGSGPKYLQDFQEKIGRPVAFVLGNHDYFHTSIQEAHLAFENAAEKNPFLLYLDNMPFLMLTDGLAIVGVNNFADGQEGYFFATPLTTGCDVFADIALIEDYRRVWAHPEKGMFDVRKLMLDNATLAADRLIGKIAYAAQYVDNIIVAIHVPPFVNACLHKGKATDQNLLPFFCSSIMGTKLKAFAQANKGLNLLLMCGHTHNEVEYRVLPNLMIRVSPAEYGSYKLRTYSLP